MAVPDMYTAGLCIIMGKFSIIDDEVNEDEVVTSVDLVQGWESLRITIKFRCLDRKCRGYRGDQTATLYPTAALQDPLELGHAASLQHRCPICLATWASVTVVQIHPAHQFLRDEFYDQGCTPVRVFDIVVRRHRMIVRDDTLPLGTWRVTLNAREPVDAEFGCTFPSEQLKMAHLRAYILRDP